MVLRERRCGGGGGGDGRRAGRKARAGGVHGEHSGVKVERGREKRWWGWWKVTDEKKSTCNNTVLQNLISQTVVV
jgi:hypothetical protein